MPSNSIAPLNPSNIASMLLTKETKSSASKSGAKGFLVQPWLLHQEINLESFQKQGRIPFFGSSQTRSDLRPLRYNFDDNFDGHHYPWATHVSSV